MYIYAVNIHVIFCLIFMYMFVLFVLLNSISMLFCERMSIYTGNIHVIFRFKSCTYLYYEYLCYSSFHLNIYVILASLIFNISVIISRIFSYKFNIYVILLTYVYIYYEYPCYLLLHIMYIFVL